MRLDSQIAPKVDRTRELRRLIGRSRATLPLLKVWPAFRSGEVVSASTDFCVEGFPFSANTFAYCSVLDSNPHLRGAHHTHQTGQVLAAVSRGIPTALVIRNPLDAVESIAVFDGGVAAAHHFLGVYDGFYRRLSRVIERGGVVVCPFDRVVADPAFVVRALNLRFGAGMLAPISEVEVISARAKELRDSRGMPARDSYEGLGSNSLDEVRKAIRSDPRLPDVSNTYDWVLGFAPTDEELATSS